jgi:hypothetical protein
VKLLLRLEETALAALAAWLFVETGYPWWWLAVFFLLPDLGMLGYLLGPRPGAVTYNLIHHRALAVVVYGLGLLAAQPLVQAAGAVLLFHSSVDRALGYGLKYGEGFNSTHLGTIGSTDYGRSNARP